MKALVLDLRNNPGGLLTTCVEIAKKLVPKGEIVSIVDKQRNKETYSSSLEAPEYPLAVLINKTVLVHLKYSLVLFKIQKQVQ